MTKIYAYVLDANDVEYTGDKGGPVYFGCESRSIAEQVREPQDGPVVEYVALTYEQIYAVARGYTTSDGADEIARKVLGMSLIDDNLSQQAG